jgi:hypothetical protein
MRMATLLVTGVPGLLATALLPRLLARRAEPRVRCLVERRFMSMAARAADALDVGPATASRLVLAEGTSPRPSSSPTCGPIRKAPPATAPGRQPR